MLTKGVKSIIFIFLIGGCSSPFPGDNLSLVALILKLMQPATTSTTTTDTRKYVFVTSSSHDGNFSGITGADSFCSSQKTSAFSSLAGASSDYKALLVDGTVRRACSTANCSGGVSENIGWVLSASTQYYLSSGTLAFTTNPAGIVNLGASSGLNSALDPTSTVKWWTGLANNWTVFPSGTCLSWANNVSINNGSYGEGAQLGQKSIEGTFGSDTCDLSFRLVCVRQ